MKNENEDLELKKSDEQIASENMLNADILDEAAKESDYANNGEGENNATEALYGIISIVPMALHMTGLKNTASVWSDSVCRGIATAAIPVLRKYAFGQKIITFLETGGGIEEFALAMALAPVAMATMSAYKLDVKPKEKEVKDAKEAGDGTVHAAETPLNSTFKFEA
ncbi:MAG: hypothetical protein ABL920_10195 [Methylotenera sp.]